jgi:hypothetical protein
MKERGLKGKEFFHPLRLSLTGRDGKTFITEEYRFLVDSSAPELEIIEDPDGSWVQNQVQIKFRASDANRIKAVEISTNLGSSWTPLLSSDEIGSLAGSVIERALDLSSAGDGVVNVSLRVTDEANKQSVKSFSVFKDTKAPEARPVVPISGARVNGTIRLGIAIKEAGRIASVTYERPGGEDEETAQPFISRQVYPNPATGDLPLTFLDLVLDANETPLDERMRFVFTDKAGNTSVLSDWSFIVDEEMDLPVVQISLPLEDEVVFSDFVISGICFDDDEVRRIYWSIDDGEERVAEARHGFSIPVPLSTMTDNEHSVSIYAEDIYGVKGKHVTRNFRVSLEEPKASVTIPALGEITGGTVLIAGTASDGNGIKRVRVSLDNGNSYNDADCVHNEADNTTEWTYRFNSRIMSDGPTVVFARVWDNFEISSLYASMLVVDNTAPELTVDTPLDGAVTTGPIYITGQAMDNLTLDSITIRFHSLDGVQVPEELAVRQAKLDSIILEELNIGNLPDGTYNVEVWAADKAGNVTRVSRNIQLAKDNHRNFIDTLYPLNGEYVQGRFNLYGYVGGIDKAGEVTMAINGVDAGSVTVNDTGYFCFSLGAEDLAIGTNRIVVRSGFGGRELVQSDERVIEYQPFGPWVTVDSMGMGDFAYDRPWLSGRAGYELSPHDAELLADRKTDRELRDALRAMSLSFVELSFDNGRSFVRTARGGKDTDWRYRLETGDMSEGLHYLVVRATMDNGETAVTRHIIQVDKTPPVIRLISPQSGGRYNTSLEYSALASDDVELRSLGYHLRKGDKAAYEIPGFIKGLYFEASIPPFIKQVWNSAPILFAGGATYMDMGFGLSFFDDNVKLQVQYGFMTQSLYDDLGGQGRLRYGGHVLGFKILANVYTLPFEAFFGPDWEWLFASFAVGANFSFFDIGKQGYTQSGESTWLSALLFQIEFPRVTIPRRTYLRTFSLFTEGQLWFVPTDVNASAQNLSTIIPHLTLGLRAYIF